MDRRLFLGLVLTTILAGIFVLAFSFQAVKASGTTYIRVDESGDRTVPDFKQWTKSYTLSLSSLEDCGCSSNVGTIVLDGVPYSLPRDIGKEAGTHSIRYDAGSWQEFIRWETSGEVSITDPYNSSTTITVNGNSIVVAIYRYKPGSLTDVDAPEAKHMIESNPYLVILDVRTPGEYESGHIQNATLIPLAELEGRLGELDKDKEILVYCRSGGRSANASRTLVSNFFSHVHNMLGGITAWRSAGYWIEINHNGNLVINGTQTYVVENCTYIQKGNVSVEEESNLVIRNSKFIIGWDCYIQLFDYSNLSIINASVHIQGNFIPWSLEAVSMVNSTLTRNHIVSTTTGSGLTVAGASLNLYDKNNVSIYGGIANSSGKAKFDVSFVDGNYTDNLRLEASKGNWSVAVDMTLLSDTPLILRLQCNSDLNADGKMDIQDITIVAIAYQTKPGDDKWNELADVDKNGMVNIIDVTLVAKDFGETV